MFRFDSFRSQSQATPTTNATREDSQEAPEDSKIKFLQRISSSDSIDKKSLTKRPSFSSMSSFSGRSGSSSSTIPVPSNSWGMLMLSTLRNDDMLEDVCSLLTKDQKATLLLPVSQPSHPSAIIDREFIEDHVMLYQSPVDMTQIVSLSGIRGTFQKDRFVALGLVERPSVHGIAASNADTSTKTRFDSFNLDPMSITSDHPSINILASHVDVSIANDQTITVDNASEVVAPPPSQDTAVDTKATPESADMARNASETSSEINLQFPPTQSKRPRRDDDQYIRSAGADVLLPLLIYTVVKSNPQKFVSNLKFIQRYRMSSKLIGEASYCLTNMLAVVAFLETTNLVGLGLSADRIMSDLSDLKAGSGSNGPNSKQRFRSPQVDQLAGGGRKLVSDVVDGVFDGIGRFWRTPESTSSASPPVLPPPTNTNKTVGGLLSMPGMAAMEEVKNQVVGRVRGSSDASSIKSQEARKQNELKEMSRTHTNESVDTQDSRPLWQRSNSQSRTDMFQSMLQAPSQFMASVVPRPSSAASSTTPLGEGPLPKFLEMKSVEEMKIGEVAELLADYKRLAAIIKQSQL
ncbi:hypothetical protein K450DRAFT_233903 [Umbelopsis ramanniana AG]|uniref:VPS9 domain-containing protein n=1 Tax=Umbelopsis ramanniana AG TaxID=1314678 RepID=A0AAD5EE49_UMBRA|nr:uncharacterized protein K450DRAFT_233903 [Umbelopsis ramanniana AG]KAI8581261.1 hypothetical protein K450DRAFT_233903 [Umbelopsis ramanniana AG]